MDHHLIEQDYPAFNTFSLTQALQRTHATFSSPFQAYSWRIKKQSIPNEPDLTVLTIIVSGPDHTKVTLERIVGN